MNFVNPAGLWALLGVPALIVIYLIKAQHEDRPVSSTYIWKLSSRFMKKRLPLQKIKKFLAFLLQLILVITVAMLASRPAVVNGKRIDYIAIIDGSASMQTVDDQGSTRFEKALEEVSRLAGELDNGHGISVMLAGDSASWLVQEAQNQNEVKMALQNAQCGYGTCDMTKALEMAQTAAQRSNNPQVVFFTDNAYTETNNIQVVDLNQNEWNVAITGVTAAAAEQGTVFIGTLVSHHRAATVTVGLRIDGAIVDARIVSCDADAPATVTFEASSVTSYDTAEIFTEAADALEADNAYVLCREIRRSHNVLLVSQAPFYLESVLQSLGNCQVTVTDTAAQETLTGYDLYIFDGVYPEEYPQDGSVLVFGTQKLPEGLFTGSVSKEAQALTMNTREQSELFAGLTLTETVVTNFSPLRGNLTWKTLFLCGEDGVIVTRAMGRGLQFTVASFDLHDSNLPMQKDYVVLMRNLVEYSVPAFLKDTDHVAGTTVELTVMPDAQELYVERPDGSIRSLPSIGSTTSLTVNAVGVYTAVMTTAEGGEYVDFFVHIPAEESRTNTLPALSLELTREAGVQVADATSEIWFWLALGMLIFVLLEWGWYYREQY